MATPPKPSLAHFIRRCRPNPARQQSPGSVNDAAAWRDSAPAAAFNRGATVAGYRLLGDMGYGNGGGIMTPFRPTAVQGDARKMRYNRDHCRMRSIVEMTIGRLKSRFPILSSELRVGPQRASKIVIACAVLHNSVLYKAEQARRDIRPYSGKLLAVFNPHLKIDFVLNNTKVANVEPNALITSNNLGYTSITGTSTVVLHAVSLPAVCASSTQITETGGRNRIRINGLDEAETPFAFGGALYPFRLNLSELKFPKSALCKVTWSVSHPGVLKVVSCTIGAGSSLVKDSLQAFHCRMELLTKRRRKEKT
ncbi:hypothetical protein OSTOST_03557 [Ostertagia ostertagi]